MDHDLLRVIKNIGKVDISYGKQILADKENSQFDILKHITSINMEVFMKSNIKKKKKTQNNKPSYRNMCNVMA
jgi:hypothetical protein